MANKEQLGLLLAGVAEWNRWREEHRGQSVNLAEADLRQKNLRGVDLSGAYLSRANLSETNLRGAILIGANLNWADLRESDMRWADLGDADLRKASVRGLNLGETQMAGVNLTGVDLRMVNLCGAVVTGGMLDDTNLSETNLREANLRKATLRRADLTEANMNGARLDEADLREANLRAADLSDARLVSADLRSARLQSAILDRANVTGAKFWESQLGGWSIREITCMLAYWDEQGTEVVRYAPGEFERLYRAQARVELVYPGGISAFEVNTLPAMLQHLAQQYPNAGIRLKSIDETGGGVKVAIYVDEVDAGTLDAVRTEAKRTQTAQLALRDDEIARLRIEKQLLLGEVMPRMLAAAGQQVTISGAATNVVIASGQAMVRAEQRMENGAEVSALLRVVLSRLGELGPRDAAKVEDASASVEEELEKPSPRMWVVKAGLEVVKEIAVKAGTALTEQAAVAGWHPLVERLTHLLTQMM